MQENEQVFLSMKEEIEKESQREVSKILEEVKAMENDALTSMQSEAKKDADLRLKQELDEMQSQASSEISESHSERTKKLIEKRDEYVKDIFAKAKEQLVAFASSEDYKNFMIAKAKEASKEALEDSVLYVRKEDLGLAEDLKKAYGHKIDVEESKEVVIGGFIIENKTSALVLNETLEFALENQKDWFNKNSGLIIK